MQKQFVNIFEVEREFPTGLTLVIDVSGEVRFVIGRAGLADQKPELEETARLAITDPMGWQIDDPTVDAFAIDYRGMHEART